MAHSSLAKKANAALRISFARRNSAFSRRSFFSSAESSLDVPACEPASTSAWRTHLRSVSFDTPTCVATERIDSHCVSCSLACSNTSLMR